jgi:VanZ family protein
MLDEWLQGFIPGRFFSMIDLAAGLLGTASAAMVVAVWRGADAPATGDTQVASDS